MTSPTTRALFNKAVFTVKVNGEALLLGSTYFHPLVPVVLAKNALASVDFL